MRKPTPTLSASVELQELTWELSVRYSHNTLDKAANMETRYNRHEGFGIHQSIKSCLICHLYYARGVKETGQRRKH
jgi:hypothetical protein